MPYVQYVEAYMSHERILGEHVWYLVSTYVPHENGAGKSPVPQIENIAPNDITSFVLQGIP
jgi:hypothetical protein